MSGKESGKEDLEIVLGLARAIRGDNDQKKVLELEAEIKRLREAAHVAFVAMCMQRDAPDNEVFQDAIDELGEALCEEES